MVVRFLVVPGSNCSMLLHLLRNNGEFGNTGAHMIDDADGSEEKKTFCCDPALILACAVLIIVHYSAL